MFKSATTRPFAPDTGVQTVGLHVCTSAATPRPPPATQTMIVGGQAGAGKSTAGALPRPSCPRPSSRYGLLWRSEFTREDGTRTIFLGAEPRVHSRCRADPCALRRGLRRPDSVEPLTERRLFSAFITSASPAPRTARRPTPPTPPTGATNTPQLIEENVTFNHWLKGNAANTTTPVTIPTRRRHARRDRARVAAGFAQRIAGNGEAIP